MIDLIIDFVKANWTWIIEVLTLLIVTLITIFKKKVSVIDTIKGTILEVLPQFIAAVERDGDGAAKKQEVLDCVKAYLIRIYPEIKVDQYVSFIKKSIEAILTTPQKKVR